MGSPLRFSLFFLTALLSTATPFSSPTGADRSPGLSDLAPHPAESKTYNEFWTYQLRLNRTIDLTVNITRGNFGSFKDPVCGANVTLNNFNGKNYTVAREYPLPNFVWNPAAARLSVHRNIFFEGLPPKQHRLFFSTSKGGVDWTIDLVFEQMEPSLTPGDGIWEIGKNKIGQMIHIPWSRVKGTLSVDGVTAEVSGTAMMDHTWQDDLAPAIIDRAYRWRIHSGSENWEVGYVMIPRAKGERPAGITLKKGATGPVLQRPVSVAVVEGKTVGGVKNWAEAIEITTDSGKETIRFAPAWSRVSVLDEFSGITRWTVKKFLGGDLVNDRGGVRIGEKRGDYAHTYLRD